ncbi:MAG: 5,6-dimethylbenzimidazole synthase [Acidimicrobiales bacterium]
MTHRPTAAPPPARWQRPVPLVGDTSDAAGRAGEPEGWGFAAEARRALYEIIAARRDVRRFRPDPLGDDLVTRVLSAAHAGPSVGHSQPWRFLLVADPAIRDSAALIADRERHRQARMMDAGSAARMLDLQLDGIREAPLGVVVCCDRRAPAAGVLGRATFPDADLWSCACAIENLWLAARAEGLGVGWVTLFPPEELASLVRLPQGVSTLGWLCVGWPDERPPVPGLERAGWSKRLPLDEVVMHDRWTPAAAPPLSHLRAPDQRSVVAARDEADALLTSPGSLGALDRALDRLAALDIDSVEGATLVLAAADHPVVAHGVSTYPSSVTRQVLEATVAGESLGAAAARTARMSLIAADAGVLGEPVPGAVACRPLDARGDIVSEDALSGADVERLLALGSDIGAARASSGVVAIGEVGIGNTTVSAALACGLLGLGPDQAVGLGATGDAGTLERKHAAVVAGLDRARRAWGPELAEPHVALQALGGPEITLLTGVILGVAGRRGAVVLDGFATTLAGICAVRMEPAVAAHLVAGQVSRELGHRAALDELGLEPLLDLRMRAGEGAGAVLAIGLVAAALAMRAAAGRVLPLPRGAG